MQVSYDRQKGVLDLNVPEVATIVGTGAIGAWVSFLAALSGVNRLVLYSIGNVKETDIARLPFSPDFVGKPYPYAMSHLLLGIRPSLELVVHGKFVPEQSEIEGIAFNCAASEEKDFDVRLYRAAKSQGLRYISGYYTPHEACVVTYADESLPPPSLEPIPVWPGVAVTTAGLMIAAAFHGREEPARFGVNLRSRAPASLNFLLEGGGASGR